MSAKIPHYRQMIEDAAERLERNTDIKYNAVVHLADTVDLVRKGQSLFTTEDEAFEYVRQFYIDVLDKVKGQVLAAIRGY